MSREIAPGKNEHYIPQEKEEPGRNRSPRKRESFVYVRSTSGVEARHPGFPFFAPAGICFRIHTGTDNADAWQVENVYFCTNFSALTRCPNFFRQLSTRKS